jgi:hypothetical protein
MKKLKTLVVVAMAGLAILSGERVYGSEFFTRDELSLDLNGFAATRDRSGNSGGAAGVGVGMNYFWDSHWGVAADTYADAFDLPYMLNSSLIFRYPIGETRFAPYAMAGFGRQWRYAAQWTGHLAGGVEYRLNHRTGVFVDVREVFPDNTDDYTVFRFGFRIKFR